MQDYLVPSIPARSRLYNLEPIGLGTPYVESLTSYINRLAHAHCVLPGKLIMQEVQPLLRVSTNVGRERVFVKAQSIETLNGMTPQVKEWVRVLEQLTQRKDLQFLSMFSWTNISDQGGVVRRTRAWCPSCYNEWLQTGRIVYEPLLWNLKVVTQCPIHHRSLLNRCPQQVCKRAIPLLTNLSQPTSCPSCGYSLAMHLVEESLEESSEDSVNEEIQQWVVTAVGVLLSAAPTLPLIPSRNQVAAGITAYIAHTLSGSDKVLIRKLGISEAMLMDWQRGLHLPRFSTLLTMCFQMNVSPLLFLTNNVESFFLAQYTLKVDNILKASQKSELINSEELQKALTELLRESADLILSLPAVAKKLGYPISTLRHYFPEQCQTITARYQQHKDVDYRQSLETFLLSSEQLTLKEIAQLLECPVSTLRCRYPELCRSIAAQKRKVLDFVTIREALQGALQCQGSSFPTTTEISKQFGCSVSVLYHHFPELCYELTKKHADIRLRGRISKATYGGLGISEAGVSIERSKRSTKNLSAENIDKMREGLEELLKSGVDHPMTMTELADRFGCSRSTLRINFPDLCNRLMKKQEKEDHINELRSALEEVLRGDASLTPCVNHLAKQLGCSHHVLRRHFPDLCKLMIQRYRGLTDVEKQRNALETVIRSGEMVNLSVDEIARRLGCSNSTLYSRFPELCKSIVKRRRQVDDIDGMRKVLETVLANDESLPTLLDLSKFFGCSTQSLNSYFPEMCRNIAEKRRRLTGINRFGPCLEKMLASDEPISVLGAATRLGCSATSLRGCFPELCKSISVRYQTHKKSNSLNLEEKICNEVREIVLDLHARGEYPTMDKVQGLVSRPGPFWRVKVRETWRDVLRELGLLD